MFKQHSARHRANTKVGAMSKTTLDQAVDQTEETYHTFRVKLKSLISTLKNHHEAMLNLNRSQMQATAAVCDFLVNTPLSQCVIGTDHCSKSDDDKSGEHTAVLRYKEDKEKETKTDLSNNETAGSKTDKPWSAGCTQSFDSAIGHGKNWDNLEESFVALTNASNDLNLVYAERYKEWIIGYLEEWEDIISTRIEGKLIQFRQMRQTYAHYTDKVQGLQGKVDKQKTKKAAGASTGLEGKLDRNRLKLSGAEEVHNDFGRSLLTLMEEVTIHYWKDMVPLLHMIIKSSINHSSDLASVMKKLDKTDAILKDVCEEHGISITGRLEDLRPEPIPENIKLDEAPEEGEKKENKEEEDDDALEEGEKKEAKEEEDSSSSES